MNSISALDNIDVRFKTTFYIFNISVLLAFVGVFIKIAFSSLKIGNEQGPGFATAVGYMVSFISLFTEVFPGDLCSLYISFKDSGNPSPLIHFCISI